MHTSNMLVRGVPLTAGSSQSCNTRNFLIGIEGHQVAETIIARHRCIGCWQTYDVAFVC